MQKQIIANPNRIVMIGVPTKILRIANIPDRNVIAYSAEKGKIIIEDTGMTIEDIIDAVDGAQIIIEDDEDNLSEGLDSFISDENCDCLCDECRAKLNSESEEI